MTTDTERLDFLIKTACRIEQLALNPSTLHYYVVNSGGEVISEEVTARDAIDIAIEILEEDEGLPF